MKKLMVLATILALAVSARAVQDWREAFDYSAGDLTNVTANWTGFSGHDGLDVIDGNLTQPGYTALGRQLDFGSVSLDAQRGFTAHATNYASWLMKIDKVYNGSSYFVILKQTSSSYFPMRLYGDQGADAGHFKLGVSASSANPLEWSADLATGVVQKLIVRFDAATGNTKLWLNPGGTEGTANVETNLPAATGGTVYNFAIRQGGNWDNGNVDVLFDEIRVGTTWDDVQVIPEGGALVALLPLLGLLRRR